VYGHARRVGLVLGLRLTQHAFSCEPLPFGLAAETALQPLTRCSEGLSAQRRDWCEATQFPGTPLSFSGRCLNEETLRAVAVCVLLAWREGIAGEARGGTGRALL